MNHNMKKRGLALLLACCCVFTAAPVAVKADNVSISTNQTPTGTYSSYTKAEVLKSDTVVYDTLSTSNNVHFYKYTAEKAGYFTVNLAQTSGKGKWNFSVYDADNGNQELETKPLASNYTSRIYNLRPGKSVYIKVERVKSMDITILDYQLTQDYQYSLQVKTTESAQWEQEDNDTPAAATSLQNGTWINGSSYKASDVDWYEYTIPENGYFTYDFQGEGSSALWNLYLYDENMNELQKDTNTRTVSSGKYVLPVGAKVYVKVTCYGVGNQYKIRSNYYATEGWERNPTISWHLPRILPPERHCMEVSTAKKMWITTATLPRAVDISISNLQMRTVETISTGNFPYMMRKRSCFRPWKQRMICRFPLQSSVSGKAKRFT